MTTINYSLLESGRSDYLLNKTLRMNIQLELTSFCNYNCHYCKSYGVDFDHEVHKEKLESFLLLLQKINLPKTFVFIGGEPTLHWECNEIVKLVSKHMNNEKNSLIFFTNASSTMYYYKRILDSMSECNYWAFMTSYHPEKQNDDVYKTLILLLNEKCNSALQGRACLMIEPDYFDRVEMMYHWFKETIHNDYLSVQLCPLEKISNHYLSEAGKLIKKLTDDKIPNSLMSNIVYNENDMYKDIYYKFKRSDENGNYTNQAIEYYSHDHTKILDQSYHSFIGMQCHPLLHLKYDRYDEVTTRCPIWWHKKFKEEDWENLLGHIEDSIICNRLRCGLDDDIMEIPKKVLF